MSSPASPALFAANDAPGAKRWAALVFVSLAQLMVALDVTIVNVALPTLQHDLGSTDATRQWVISAYTLCFAGFLLLGGRLVDMLGQRRAFLLGVAGFAASSALGGAAGSFAALVAARALQGTFAALLSPSVLSVLTVNFRAPRERAKAFGIYGGVAGSGAAVGLVLGGALTEAGNWRWCLYVNVLFAAIAMAGAALTVPARPAVEGHASARVRNGLELRASARERTEPASLDVAGALLISAGLAGLAYASASACVEGFDSNAVLLRFALALVALTLFVVRQRFARAPLLPLHIVADRTRAIAYAVAAMAVVSMFGLFLLLTYYFQSVRHDSPLRTGLAFLPMSAGALLGSTAIARSLLPRVPARTLMISGLSIAALGMALIVRIGPASHYLVEILPAELLVGLGTGCAMMPTFSLATLGVAPREAGVASATITAAQQLGGSLGTAFLNTIAASASAAYLAEHGATARADSLVHGYSLAASWGAGILLAAALLAAFLPSAAPQSAR